MSPWGLAEPSIKEKHPKMPFVMTSLWHTLVLLLAIHKAKAPHPHPIPAAKKTEQSGDQGLFCPQCFFR